MTGEYILNAARTRLGRPLRPEPETLVQLFWDRVQYYRNWERETGEAWQLYEKRLTVSTNTSVYSLASEPTFGGAFIVTTDPAMYSDQRRREVDVVRPQDVGMVRAPYSVQDWPQTAEPDTVACFSFYQNQTGWQCQTYPASASGWYVILYEPVAIAQVSLQNEPMVVTPFHYLLGIATAFDAVEQCHWEGCDEVQDAARQARYNAKLTTLLLHPTAGAEAQFRQYIRSMNQPQSGFRVPFESSPGASVRGGRWPI